MKLTSSLHLQRERKEAFKNFPFLFSNFCFKSEDHELTWMTLSTALNNGVMYQL